MKTFLLKSQLDLSLDFNLEILACIHTLIEPIHLLFYIDVKGHFFAERLRFCSHYFPELSSNHLPVNL